MFYRTPSLLHKETCITQTSHVDFLARPDRAEDLEMACTDDARCTRLVLSVSKLHVKVQYRANTSKFNCMNITTKLRMVFASIDRNIGPWAQALRKTIR